MRVLAVWLVIICVETTHDWLYRMHTRWYKLSVETFDAANYIGIAIYKIGVMLFVLVPLIALWLV